MGAVLRVNKNVSCSFAAAAVRVGRFRFFFNRFLFSLVVSPHPPPPLSFLFFLRRACLVKVSKDRVWYSSHTLFCFPATYLAKFRKSNGW